MDDSPRVVEHRRPIERLAYRRTEVAAALGISPTKFDELVKDGRMPRPVRVDSCVLWDAAQVRAYWEALADGQDPVDKNEWDE